MKRSGIGDILKFTGKFFSKPRFTGSILPSSSFLGRAMAQFVKFSPEQIVVELGPGTGPVTAQLLKSGIPPENLYCIEFDGGLCEILRRRFPDVAILNDSAENLRSLLAGERRGICAIVSSLPFLSLPKAVGEKIVSESEGALQSGGRFIQFTYNLNRDPREVGFKAMAHVACKKVYLNVPPARVDAFEKR